MTTASTYQLCTIGLVTSLLLMGCTGDADKKLSLELAAAQQKALVLCAGCHGPTGVGTNALIPNLAGQHKAYMVKQLMDYRSGQRSNHPPMTYIARMLMESEVALISEWYAGLPAASKITDR